MLSLLNIPLTPSTSLVEKLHTRSERNPSCDLPLLLEVANQGELWTMAVKADPAEKQPQSTAKNGKDEAKIEGQTTAKSGLPVCINKDLLAHGHAFIFILSVAALCCSGRAE